MEQQKVLKEYNEILSELKKYSEHYQKVKNIIIDILKKDDNKLLEKNMNKYDEELDFILKKMNELNVRAMRIKNNLNKLK